MKTDISWVRKAVGYVLSKLLRKKGDPPFILVDTKPTIKLDDGDKVEMEMICPVCNVHWADATVHLGAPVTPENFVLKKSYEGRVKIEAGKAIHCPDCGWEYTSWAIQASVLAALNRKRMNATSNQGWKTFGTGG